MMLLTSLPHSPIIPLFPQRHQPRHFVFQKHEFEIREQGCYFLAVFGFGPEACETDAHVFVVGSTLDLDAAEVLSDRSRPVAFSGEGMLKLTSQIPDFSVEDFRAGVGVE